MVLVLPCTLVRMGCVESKIGNGGVVEDGDGVFRLVRDIFRLVTFVS